MKVLTKEEHLAKIAENQAWIDKERARYTEYVLSHIRPMTLKQLEQVKEEVVKLIKDEQRRSESIAE